MNTLLRIIRNRAAAGSAQKFFAIAHLTQGTENLEKRRLIQCGHCAWAYMNTAESAGSIFGDFVET